MNNDAIADIEKSNGHLFFTASAEYGTYEYFAFKGNIYRAQVKYASGVDAGSYLEVGPNVRSGARWVAGEAHLTMVRNQVADCIAA